jgi:hypothetical protein
VWIGVRPPFECHAAHGKDRVNDFETAKLRLGVRVPATGSIEKRIRLSKPVRIGQFMN